MKIACLQTNIAWNNAEDNLRAYSHSMQTAHKNGAELIALPEMFSCGFSLVVGDEALHIARESEKFLQDFAARNDVFVAASFPRASATGFLRPYNSLQIYGPRGHTASYDKIHLFSPGDEAQKYSAGTQPQVAKIKSFRMGLAVCYDLRFPALFSKLASEVDGFLVVANWPRARQAHWRALLIARAIENQMYMVGVNRVGSDPTLEYIGGSMVVSPLGHVLCEGSDKEEVLYASIDEAEVSSARKSMPVLADRIVF